MITAKEAITCSNDHNKIEEHIIRINNEIYHAINCGKYYTIIKINCNYDFFCKIREILRANGYYCDFWQGMFGKSSIYVKWGE